MNDGGGNFKKYNPLENDAGRTWTLELPSHGGNTGSNPVGDANFQLDQ
jgi:hypothetical protein